jgi:AraC family transcriptional regulator
VIQQMENGLKELEKMQNLVPFAPSATSYGMGWKGLQAVRYRDSSGSEFSAEGTSTTHVVVLHVRPPEKMDLRYEGVKRNMLPPAGAMAVVPALDGLNVSELHSAMLAADAEMRAGGVGGPLMTESHAIILSVHLIRHTTGARRLPVSADGVLPRRKLRTVIEYIMENLEGSPTLEQMAAVVHLSPYHFARQFKATTGSPPHQYVIARRIELAQQLLQRDGGLSLAEVALRVGFSDQSKFSFHFKRIVGVTPGQFRISARKAQKSPSPGKKSAAESCHQGRQAGFSSS